MTSDKSFKYITIALASVALLLGLWQTYLYLRADVVFVSGKTPVARIAQFDLARCQAEAEIYQYVRQTIEKYRSQFYQEIAKNEEELHKDYKAVKATAHTTSPEKASEAEKKFESRQRELEQLVQTRRDQLGALYENANETLAKAVQQYVDKIMASRGIDTILTSASVMGGRIPDITGDVIDYLGKDTALRKAIEDHIQDALKDIK